MKNYLQYQLQPYPRLSAFRNLSKLFNQGHFRRVITQENLSCSKDEIFNIEVSNNGIVKKKIPLNSIYSNFQEKAQELRAKHLIPIRCYDQRSKGVYLISVTPL
jgi:hypothetical protein